MQYRLRLMNDQNEILGQKLFVVNDLTKQNISVSFRVCIQVYSCVFSKCHCYISF